MVASSVQVLVVCISCAILTLVMKIAWISEPSSVQSTTANLSVDGSTSGNPIPKWKVIWSLYLQQIGLYGDSNVDEHTGKLLPTYKSFDVDVIL